MSGFFLSGDVERWFDFPPPGDEAEGAPPLFLPLNVMVLHTVITHLIDTSFDSVTSFCVNLAQELCRQPRRIQVAMT